jgi:hypothetical protein
MPSPALGSIQPPFQWGTGSSFPKVKQVECEADHFPLSSAEVKNVWSYTSTAPYIFMAWYMVENRENFAF